MDVKGQIGFASGDMSVGVNWLTLDIERSPAVQNSTVESDVGGSISYSMAGKGMVTVPGVTNLNISVSGDIFPKLMEMRATFAGTVFDTQASLVFAASKERSGVNSTTKFYAVFEMPDGVSLTNIPGINQIPKIEEMPVLGKGTKIAYSNYAGFTGSLSPEGVLAALEKGRVELEKAVAAAVTSIGIDGIGNGTDVGASDAAGLLQGVEELVTRLSALLDPASKPADGEALEFWETEVDAVISEANTLLKKVYEATTSKLGLAEQLAEMAIDLVLSNAPEEYRGLIKQGVQMMLALKKQLREAQADSAASGADSILAEEPDSALVTAAEAAQREFTNLFLTLELPGELKDRLYSAYSVLEECKGKAEKWAEKLEGVSGAEMSVFMALSQDAATCVQTGKAQWDALMEAVPADKKGALEAIIASLVSATTALAVSVGR